MVFHSGDPLEQFTKEEGKLANKPMAVHDSITTADECARKCIQLDHCAGFNYDYGTTMKCELLTMFRQFDEKLYTVSIRSHSVQIQLITLKSCNKLHYIGHTASYSFNFSVYNFFLQ